MKKKFLMGIVIAFSIIFLTSFAIDFADARGGGGGGGHSGGGGGHVGGGGRSSGMSMNTTRISSPSVAKPAPSKTDFGPSKPAPSKTDFGPSKPAPSKSDFGSPKPANAATVAPKGSKADQAVYEKAKMNGTAFKTREDAQKSFAAKHADQYPSKYAKEPAVRPSHIPQTTMVGGTSYTVIYNPGFGGYGYYSGGRWMAYNAMMDAVIVSSLMNHHGYYYGAPPVVTYAGFSPLTWIISLIVFVVMVILMVALIRKLR